MILEQLNPGAHKTYLVADEETGRSVLVDPLLDGADAYMARIGELRLSLGAVVQRVGRSVHNRPAPIGWR